MKMAMALWSSRPEKAEKEGICTVCSQGFFKGDPIHIIHNATAHVECNPFEDFVSKEIDQKEEPVYTVKGARPQSLCPYCNLEHAGECW